MPPLVLQGKCSERLTEGHCPGTEPGAVRGRILTLGSGPSNLVSPHRPLSNCQGGAPAWCLVPLHPSTQGPPSQSHLAALDGAWERARARARGPAPPAKMFPLGVIDKLECRETKLFMR